MWFLLLICTGLIVSSMLWPEKTRSFLKTAWKHTKTVFIILFWAGICAYLAWGAWTTFADSNNSPIHTLLNGIAWVWLLIYLYCLWFTYVKLRGDEFGGWGPKEIEGDLRMHGSHLAAAGLGAFLIFAMTNWGQEAMTKMFDGYSWLTTLPSENYASTYIYFGIIILTSTSTAIYLASRWKSLTNYSYTYLFKIVFGDGPSDHRQNVP